MQVHCDATIAFPLIVAATFARKFHGAKQANWISGFELNRFLSNSSPQVECSDLGARLVHPFSGMEQEGFVGSKMVLTHELYGHAWSSFFIVHIRSSFFVVHHWGCSSILLACCRGHFMEVKTLFALFIRCSDDFWLVKREKDIYLTDRFGYVRIQREQMGICNLNSVSIVLLGNRKGGKMKNRSPSRFSSVQEKLGYGCQTIK